MILNTATKVLTYFFKFTTATDDDTIINRRDPSGGETTDLMGYFTGGKFFRYKYNKLLERKIFSQEIFYDWVIGLKTNKDDRYCGFMDSIIDGYCPLAFSLEKLYPLNKLVVEYLKFKQCKMLDNIEYPREGFKHYRDEIHYMLFNMDFKINYRQLGNIKDYSTCYNSIKEDFYSNPKECPNKFLIDLNELVFLLCFDPVLIQRVTGLKLSFETLGDSPFLSGYNCTFKKRNNILYLRVIYNCKMSEKIRSIYMKCMKAADICKFTNLLSLIFCSPPQMLGFFSFSFIDNFKECLKENKDEPLLVDISSLINKKLEEIIPITEKNISESSNSKEVVNNDFTEKNILFCLFLAKELKIVISEPNKEKLKEYFTRLQVKIDSLNEREFIKKETKDLKRELNPSSVLSILYGKVSSEMETFDKLRLTRLLLLIRKFTFLMKKKKMFLHHFPFLEMVLESSELEESKEVFESYKILKDNYVDVSNKGNKSEDKIPEEDWLKVKQKKRETYIKSNGFYKDLIFKLDNFIENLVKKIEEENKRAAEEENTGKRKTIKT